MKETSNEGCARENVDRRTQRTRERERLTKTKRSQGNHGVLAYTGEIEIQHRAGKDEMTEDQRTGLVHRSRGTTPDPHTPPLGNSARAHTPAIAVRARTLCASRQSVRSESRCARANIEPIMICRGVETKNVIVARQMLSWRAREKSETRDLRAHNEGRRTQKSKL